jgi:hypothetical protein
MYCVNLGLKGGQRHISDDALSNSLEVNLKAFYDWAFLSQLGGWTEVTVPTSGIYGADFSRLRMVSDPNYTDGQVWETPRKDLVWESGVDYENKTGGTDNPLAVGNPIVNGVPVTTGYYINYQNGQVIFNNAVAGTVKLQHSYRSVQIYRADDAPWWRQIQQNSFRPDSSQYLQSESGNWSIFGQHRIQLPAVVIEVVPRGLAEGVELGSDALRHSRDILFNVVAETAWERNNLMDIFNAQVERGIWLFNTNDALNEWPFDYRGSLTGDKTYPYFVSSSGYRWRVCDMNESFITDVQQVHPNLYMATVRTTTETIV